MGKVTALLLSLFLYFVLSPSLPIKNLPKTFVVTSGSMEPLVKSASLAVTKNVDPKSLKIGDIVAFSSPDNPSDTILHRISSIKSTSPLRFSTKGDNNHNEDSWDLVKASIKGKYVFSIPYLGKLIAFTQTSLGFILIICLPALVIVASQIIKINKIVKSESKTLSSKNTFLPLLFILFFSLLIPSKNISALYTSTAHTSDLIFSIKEINSPESYINMDDNYTRNIGSFDISALAFDDSSVAVIKLYYSFNFNPWQEYPGVIYGQEGVFHFSSPQGDGLYSFATLATDIFSNSESKDFGYFDYQIKVDTTPPTTNLNCSSVPTPNYSGQNYLKNGDFSSGMEGWTVSSSLGDHHIINIDDNEVFILGSNTTSINGTDSVFQTISLPSSVSSTLSFSYRFFSHDIADFDHFNVNLTDLSGTNILENILNFGNLNSDDFNYDSGWISLSRSLIHLAGQTFNLVFSLTDLGEGSDFNSWVYFDNVFLSTLDSRVGETSTINFLVTDLGSQIIDSPPNISLNIGENNIIFSSLDSSDNQEIYHLQSILVLSPLVLNKISQNNISLFNNSQSEDINLNNYSYSLNAASPVNLIGSVAPSQSFDIVLPESLSSSSKIQLFLNNNLVDSVFLDNLDQSFWQRSIDGLGPWQKINAPPSFNLEARLSVSKITLSISGLVSTLADMSYTIDYSDISGPQQIYGQIFANTIDSQGNSFRDFYLGTCSSGGTCIPSTGIGDSFVVTFSNLAPKTFIFN